jgi:hypothetical protein
MNDSKSKPPKDCDCGNPGEIPIFEGREMICRRCHTLEKTRKDYIRNSNFVSISGRDFHPSPGITYSVHLPGKSLA